MSYPSWLTAASRAPSAHNTQPWLFVAEGGADDGRVAVHWQPERALPVADPTSRDLYLSLGAAIESAILHAAADGTPLRFEPAPDGQESGRLVGWLAPYPDRAAPHPDDLALAAQIERRQTARGPHLPSPVPADVQAALVTQAERHGCRLLIATDRPTVHRLAKLAAQATALLFADAAVHAELWRWLRLDPAAPAYHEDGLTADCLELDGLNLWLARQMMPPARMRWLSRLGLHALPASDTWKTTRESAAICLLMAPGYDRPTRALDRNRSMLVQAGRTLQRVWLLAAAHGLTTHPLSALLDRPETAGQTANLFAARETAASAIPVAIFRLGYASPAPRSPRLPIDAIWQEAQATRNGAENDMTHGPGSAQA